MTPQEYINREQEIRQAEKEYPGVEVGEAYRRWKESRGEKPTFLSTGDQTVKDARRTLKEIAHKICDKCGGKAILEGVCGGCVEGRKGYKTKFTCEDCLHRELSTKEYMEWLKELSSSVKE
jgi:hypothetical protein